MHVGKRIREVTKEQGQTVKWLAENIPCERSNVYNLFRRANIGVDLLMRISQILHHDFFAELSEEYLGGSQKERER